MALTTVSPILAVRLMPLTERAVKSACGRDEFFMCVDLVIDGQDGEFLFRVTYFKCDLDAMVHVITGQSISHDGTSGETVPMRALARRNVRGSVVEGIASFERGELSDAIAHVAAAAREVVSLETPSGWTSDTTWPDVRSDGWIHELTSNTRFDY